MADSKDIRGEEISFDLVGRGPFQFPHLDQLKGVTIPEGKDWVLAEFLSQEGKQLYVPLSYQAAAELVNAQQGTYPLHEGSFQAIPVDISGPGPFELPYLEEFVCPLQVDSSRYAFGFVNQKDQRFYVSLSPEAYRLLLDCLKLALTKKLENQP